MSRDITARQGSLLWFHIGAIFTIIAWGCSFVATKVLLENGFNPTEVYVYRTVLAYLLVLAINHGRILSNSLRDELLFVACGLSAGSLYFIAENTALKYTLVTNVSLIGSLSPILTALLLGFVYKNDRPSRYVYMGSLIALVGAGFVIFNSSLDVSVNPLGDLLAFGGAMSWAVYSLILRKLNAFYSVMFITRKTFFYGMLTALPFLAVEPYHTPLSALLQWDAILNFLFLGVFCSMLAFIIWAWVNKGLGAVTAGNYLYFQPVVTMIASALILSERVTLIGYIGCSLILFGVWYSDRKKH